MNELEITLDLTDKRIIVYDFETDGFWNNNGSARPIEVAVLVIEPDGKIHRYHELIKRRDNKPLPPKITELTGITTEDLAERGLPIEEVFEKLSRAFGAKNKLVVGHNIINFDNKFLNFRFNKLGYNQICNNDCFDTAGQFKAELLGWDKFPNITYAEYHIAALNVRAKGVFYNLKAACERYGIPVDPTMQHRADYDVELNTKVFLEQMNILGLLTEPLSNLEL